MHGRLVQRGVAGDVRGVDEAAGVWMLQGLLHKVREALLHVLAQLRLRRRGAWAAPNDSASAACICFYWHSVNAAS